MIAEELGFIGVVILLSAYGFIGYRAFRLSEQVEDPFAKYVSIGVGLWILTQASVNIGVNLNILPLTGITLPFVSYGGSSLLSLLIASGILLNISRSARVVDTRGNSYKNTPFERRRSLTDMRA